MKNQKNQTQSKNNDSASELAYAGLQVAPPMLKAEAKDLSLLYYFPEQIPYAFEHSQAHAP